MNIYVARQPIFDRSRQIVAYELLFRDSMDNVFPRIDGNTATSKLLTSSFLNIGLERLTGGKIAYINFTRDLLLRQVPTMFPPEEITIEVLEDVRVDEPVVEACRRMADSGYRLALDDFVFYQGMAPLIGLAQVIKIDFMAMPMAKIQSILDRIGDGRIQFLAEKIETYADFQTALEMKFTYFQGYFFSKPEILESREIPPSKLSLLQILSELHRSEFRLEKIEKMIHLDVSIAYKLLRYINSAYFRRLQEITSIRQAMVLLGENGLRQFLSLVTAAELAAGKPTELIRTAIIRAKLGELIGSRLRHGPGADELFLLGLFSLIDAMLDAPMIEIMDKLPLADTVKSALSRGEGPMAPYLSLFRAYETGDWDSLSECVTRIGVDPDRLPEYYIEAVNWAEAYPV